MPAGVGAEVRKDPAAKAVPVPGEGHDAVIKAGCCPLMHAWIECSCTVKQHKDLKGRKPVIPKKSENSFEMT